ncbi:MAG: ABC transporter ATP-binding protein [Oscillospiraceae bacterium]
MSTRFKKFLSYYKPYKKLLFADLFCAFIVAAISLTIPLCIRYITNNVLIGETIEISKIMQVGLFMLSLVLIEFICNFFITYKGHSMGVYMEHDMRNELFSHYQKLSFSFYDNQKTGTLMSRITHDIFTLAELYHHGPEDIVISIIKFLGAFIILFQINALLTVLVFAILPFMFLFTYFCNKKMRKAFRKNKEHVGNLNSQIEDNLSGIRVVKSFASEKEEVKKFSKQNKSFVKSKKQSYRVMATFHSGLGAFVTSITITVIVLGSLFIGSGVIIVGDLLTFLLYINNFTDPIKKLINFTEQFQEGMTGFDRFMDILEIEPDIKDSKLAKNIENVKGEISFNNVSFRYNENTGYVLKDINLNIKTGEYVAIVGTSGAGKTTLCSLIPRFYELSQGDIFIDNKNIKDVTLKSLRNNIGIVQQDVYLFSGNILENIRYGNINATDEEVVEAAIKANAHDFIMQLKDGYDTDIGQRGVKLSGGQKQRLSIARVFLKNPPILIFDEATSALDNESEKIVQESLELLAKNRTTLVIAHRLSTIKNAEKIIVLSEDGILEEGSHKYLMNLNNAYASLYNMQFKN